MFRRAILMTVLNFTLSIVCQSQVPEIKEIRHSVNQYQDFVFNGDKIWALTTKGELSVFDIKTENPVPKNVRAESAIIFLASDRRGNIIIADKNNEIKKYDTRKNAWIPLFKFHNTLLGITFDGKNSCYLITNKGIFDCLKNKYYYPDGSLNGQIKHGAGWFRKPALATDKNENIWIGFGYGEWGGDLFIFNTISKKFVVPKMNGFQIELEPIKSIFEVKEDIYVTSGLMHFSTSGSIARFHNFQLELVFESKERRKFPNDSASNETLAGEYIGPGTYNEEDSCIYFYSQNGIFKGNPLTDLSEIEYWSKILQPELHWTNGQPDAVGSPMNVLKILSISREKLVFLSQNDGIGIFNGRTLIMLQ